jgi:hypothetical protein
MLIASSDQAGLLKLFNFSIFNRKCWGAIHPNEERIVERSASVKTAQIMDKRNAPYMQCESRAYVKDDQGTVLICSAIQRSI